MKGSASIYYKGCGKAKTNINANEALDGLIKGLRSENQAFIYHCYNHYFCPIGFDLTPNATKDAY